MTKENKHIYNHCHIQSMLVKIWLFLWPTTSGLNIYEVSSTAWFADSYILLISCWRSSILIIAYTLLSLSWFEFKILCSLAMALSHFFICNMLKQNRNGLSNVIHRHRLDIANWKNPTLYRSVRPSIQVSITTNFL